MQLSKIAIESTDWNVAYKDIGNRRRCRHG